MLRTWTLLNNLVAILVRVMYSMVTSLNNELVAILILVKGEIEVGW